MRLRRTLIAACCALLMVGLSGCETKPEAEAPKPPEEPEVTVEELAAQAYSEILDNIGDYDFKAPADIGLKGYTYSLVKITTHKVPLLLVNRENQDFFVNTVRLFSYNEDTKKVTAPDEVLSVGVASAGGFRGGLSVTAENPYLEYFTMLSGTGATVIEKIDVENGELTKTTLWEGRFDLQSESEYGTPETAEIVWTDIADRTPLEEYCGKNLETDSAKDKNEHPDANAEQKAKDTLDALIKEKRDAGMVVLQGALKQVTSDELLALQGISDPNPGVEYPPLYTILVLTSKEEVAFQSGDGTGPRTAIPNMVLLSDFTGDIPTDGKPVYVSFDPKETYWPSDTRLPLGEPASSSYEVLGH